MFMRIVSRLAVVAVVAFSGFCGAMDNPQETKDWTLVGKKPSDEHDPKKGGKMPRVKRKDWRRLSPQEAERLLGFKTFTKHATDGECKD